MRILVISNYYPPYFDGGYELSIAGNMRYLQQRGHQIYVLCGSKGYKMPMPLADFEQKPLQPALAYLEAWEKPHARSQNRQIKAVNYRRALRAIQRVSPDIIYLGNQKLLSTGPALAAQNSGIPVVYDMGDDWLNAYLPSSFRQRLGNLLNPPYLRGSIRLNPVISPSEWFAAELKSRYGLERSYVIPRTVELARPKTVKTEYPLKFIFAGRIEPLKGLQLVIDIAPEVISQQPDFKLDIYGDDSEAYAIELKQKIAAAGLSKHFCFKGKCFDMTALLAEYDVLLMPTLAHETFGRIIIEAMAAATIVIASNHYGPAEIIDSPRDSLLFEPNNAPALSQAILSLYQMDTSKLDALKERAYQKVLQNYSPDKHIPHLEEILNQEITMQNAYKRGSK